MRRGILLDFDGTMVRTYPQPDKPHRGPRTIKEIEYLPGVSEGCRRLRQAGFSRFVLSNQPDVSRGLVSRYQIVCVINDTVRNSLAEMVYVCPHRGRDNCSCRKPNAGLIYAAAYEHELDLAQSWMIGDSSRDEEAALAAGVRFLKTDGTDFMEKVEWILRHSK